MNLTIQAFDEYFRRLLDPSKECIISKDSNFYMNLVKKRSLSKVEYLALF